MFGFRKMPSSKFNSGVRKWETNGLSDIAKEIFQKSREVLFSAKHGKMNENTEEGNNSLMENQEIFPWNLNWDLGVSKIFFILSNGIS